MIALAAVLIVLSQNPPADTAPTSGYPDCDRYIRMVTECMRTKMPSSERAEEAQRLERFRSMLENPLVGPSLAAKCAENVRLEIQRDRYGCYVANAVSAGIQTPCSLVTRAELEEIVKRRLREGNHSGARCVYGAAGTPPLPVVIEVHWTNGRDEMSAAREATRKLANRVRTSSGERMVAGRTIAGLGDDGYLIEAGLTPLLYVRKGDTVIGVEAGGAAEQQLVAIARKAIERLK